MAKNLSLLTDTEIYSKIFLSSSSENGEELTQADEANEEAKNDRILWENIVAEYDNKRKDFENFLKSNPKTIAPLPPEIVKNTVWGYMDREVFPLLIPALNSMMFKAQKWNAVQDKKSRFNGLDHMAELLWNFNPKYPDRYKSYTDIYDIPFVRQHLKRCPRKIFPKSEIWTRNHAALIIQSYYRGHCVRVKDDVQQMRQFWRQYKDDLSKQLTVLAYARSQTSSSRHLSARLQCFCELNLRECVNVVKCPIHNSSTAGMNTAHDSASESFLDEFGTPSRMF